MIRRLALPLLLLVSSIGAIQTVAAAAVVTSSFSVQLDWFPNVEYVSLYHGQPQDYFAKSNIHLDVRPWKLGMDVIKEVSEGRADIGLYDAIPFLAAIDRGEDLVAIYAFMQETPLCLVSTRHELKSVNDLAGKKVATVKGCEYLVDYLRLKYPRLADKIDFQLLDNNVIPLEKGEIDVGIFFETAQAPLVRLHGHKLSILRYQDMGFDVYSHVIFVRRDFYNSHRAVLQKFAKALQRSMAATFRDPAGAAAFFANQVRYTDSVDGPFKDDAEYRRYQEACLKMLHYYMSKGVGENYGLMNRYRWRAMIQTLRAMRMLKRDDLDENAVFTNDLLKGAHDAQEK